MRVMKLLLKGCFPLLLALAFLARGAAALCPPKTPEHDCCGKSAPAAPQKPCAEMSCCLVLPAAPAPALLRSEALLSLLPAGPVLLPPAGGSAFIIGGRRDSGPPGPHAESSSSRAPPLLHG